MFLFIMPCNHLPHQMYVMLPFLGLEQATHFSSTDISTACVDHVHSCPSVPLAPAVPPMPSSLRFHYLLRSRTSQAYTLQYDINTQYLSAIGAYTRSKTLTHRMRNDNNVSGLQRSPCHRQKPTKQALTLLLENSVVAEMCP